MSENVLQTVQQVLQDVIAPDVRELKVRMAAFEKLIASLQKQMEVQFAALDRKHDAQFDKNDALDRKHDAQFDALNQKNDAQFKALMAAVSESRAQAEMTNMRLIASISERLAVLESQRH